MDKDACQGKTDKHTNYIKKNINKIIFVHLCFSCINYAKVNKNIRRYK